MDKSSIEGNAVDYVRIALRNTNIIKPELKEGDKTLSWDGELFVYNSDEFSKANLKAIIPAQVKGRTLKKYTKTHPIAVSDLISFKKKKNILYFVVQIVNNEYRISYVPLQLYDLEKLLKNAGKRKTISLPLTDLPFKNATKVKSIILSFIKDAERQSQIIPGVFNTGDLQEKIKKPVLTFNVDMRSNFSGADIYSSIITQKPYVYYKDEKGVEFPVDKLENIQNLVVGHHNDIPIFVDDIQYYDGYDILDDNTGTTIRIGRQISILLKEHKLTLNYGYAGTVQERLNTLSFILAIHNGSILAFGDFKLPIQTMLLKDKELKRIEKLVKFYKDIITLFKRLGIQKELNLDDLTQQQTNNLYDFCQSELYDKEVSLGLKNTGQGVLRLNNINIYCFCIKGNKGNKVYSIFNDKYVGYCIIIGDEQIPVSPYVMLADKTTETFEKIDNVNFFDLVPSIKKYGIPSKTEDAHIHLLLKMLLYYDKIKNPNILDACIALATILYEQNKSEINFINLTQTIKRKQKLAKETIQDLVSLKNSSSRIDIKLACCILLESKLECEHYLSELSHSQIEEFQHYPIMNLYSQT